MTPIKRHILRAKVQVQDITGDPVDVVAVVDSGADNSVMPMHTAQKLGYADYIEPTSMEYYNTNGALTPALGVLSDIPVMLGEDLTHVLDFNLSDATNYNLLLGADLLEPIGAVLSYRRNAMSYINEKGEEGQVPFVRPPVGRKGSSLYLTEDMLNAIFEYLHGRETTTTAAVYLSETCTTEPSETQAMIQGAESLELWHTDIAPDPVPVIPKVPRSPQPTPASVESAVATPTAADLRVEMAIVDKYGQLAPVTPCVVETAVCSTITLDLALELGLPLRMAD